MSESQKRGVNQVINETYISANGSVGLEFENIEPIKNLIERITDDYNVKVVNYLESARARQSQLRFSKLDISTEVQECIDSVNRQNRSLNEFKEQLISYQKKVNETEQNIIDQLSKIKLDVATNQPSAIPLSATSVTTESIVVKSSSDIAVPEVEKEEESILDKVLDLLCKVGDQLINALQAATEWISSWLEKLDATMKDLGIEINPFKILDDILNEAIKLNTTVVEALHLNEFNLFGNVIDILNGFQDLRDQACAAVYDLEIPILSDFVGAYAGIPIDGESSFITILGAYARGIWVDGVEGTAEAILQIGADPLGAVEGITHILAYPKESFEAIKEGVMAFVNDKVVNGTPEDRAAVAGQVVFEAFTWIVGIGEAKAAKAATVSKTEAVASKVDDVAKVIDNASKTLDDIRYEQYWDDVANGKYDIPYGMTTEEYYQYLKGLDKVDSAIKGGSKARLTEPILEKGSKPKGNYEKNRPGADGQPIIRQNESADLLASEGYDIEMLPEKKGGNGYGKKPTSNPDFLINGEAFDCYSPDGSNIRNIWSTVEQKTIKQADRIVLNLDDYTGSIDELYKQFKSWDIENLKELLVIKNGKITRWIP